MGRRERDLRVLDRGLRDGGVDDRGMGAGGIKEVVL